jgi:hypothetical protein
MAFLFSGLSEAGVSVISGRAIQNETQWDARWTLDFSRAIGVPESLDYVAMALQRPTTTKNSVPVISSYQIARRADQSLQVRLQPDQIGFLSRVLSRLSLIMLFPSKSKSIPWAARSKTPSFFAASAGWHPRRCPKSLDILLKSCAPS